MKHLTNSSSPALQRHVGTAQYESPESLYKTDVDIHCPAAKSPGLNARSSGCIARLTASKVELSCRRCETGAEVLARLKPDVSVAEIVCKCGQKAVAGKTKCQKCIDAANAYGKKYWRDKNKDHQRKCKNCQSDIESHVTYCDPCRPIIAEQKRLKKNADRKKQTLLRKQKRIKKELAAME